MVGRLRITITCGKGLIEQRRDPAILHDEFAAIPGADRFVVTVK